MYEMVQKRCCRALGETFLEAKNYQMVPGQHLRRPQLISRLAEDDRMGLQRIREARVDRRLKIDPHMQGDNLYGGR